jgi:hypothetical protein
VTPSRRSEKQTRRGALCLGFIVVLCLGPLSGAAYAQLDAVQIPGVSDVTDTVKDTTGTVGGAVKDTGGTVGDTVTDTGGTVGDTVGGDVGDTVKDTTGTVGGAVKDTSGTVGGAVKDTSGTVGGAVQDTGDRVDNTSGAVKDAADSVAKTVSGTGGIAGESKSGSKQRGGKNSLTSAVDDPLAKLKALGAKIKNESLDRTRTDIALPGTGATARLFEEATTTGGFPSFADLVGTAGEAAVKFAFPLALTMMVLVFIIVQGKVDSRDPKLAMAAIDSEDDLLSFA